MVLRTSQAELVDLVQKYEKCRYIIEWISSLNVSVESNY